MKRVLTEVNLKGEEFEKNKRNEREKTQQCSIEYRVYSLQYDQ